MKWLFSVFTLFYCGFVAGAEANSETVTAYYYDSCAGPVWEWSDVKKALSEVEVLSFQKGYDGLIYSVEDKECGDRMLNIVSLKKKDYEVAKVVGFEDCKTLEEQGGGCHPVVYSDLIPESKDKSFVHIYKHSVENTCGNNMVSLNEMAKELETAEIVVYQKHQGVDALLYPLSCGQNAGKINVYVIERTGLVKSMLMGYQECAYLKLHKKGDCVCLLT